MAAVQTPLVFNHTAKVNIMIDIKAVKEEARKDIEEEFVKKAKDALLRQMRVVKQVKQILRAEEVKLADIETQISDGTL